MAESWSNIEIEIIVSDYFDMLKHEIAGNTYNKTEHRKLIMPLLKSRTDGSIEYKYQNISAVLLKLGLPWINGYKPAWNYQHALEEKVIEFVSQNLSLENTFKEFAETNIKELDKGKLIYDQMLEEPPMQEDQLVFEPEMPYENPVKVNYLEVEQNNSRLGNYGEEIALGYERWRLMSVGKESLAEKVEWVSQTQGDWIGYDILSKNTNGTDRYIEVKTTKLGKDSPIFFTRNEYSFSVSNFKNYYLYRIFNFNKIPRIFIVNGKFEDFCKVQPVKFKGYF